MPRPARLLLSGLCLGAFVALSPWLPASDNNLPNETGKSHPANRLAKETSPYLLLHAHNPVDWYPWGEEALATAKRDKKPIFLSIGYSSCYWCHVMERESFTDDEIAGVLNQSFICIKVDREERPDVDEVYMRALEIYNQASGSKQGGGWPMSMFLTPDAKPLAGGTYFPPRDVEGRTGFLTTIKAVHEAWSKNPQQWQKVADQLAEYVKESLRQRPSLGLVKLEPTLVDAVEGALAEQYDQRCGGFGFSEANPKKPKFPEAPNLVFLLKRTRNGHEPAKKMLLNTLEKMAQGGIFDHLGGGFHRYSTDRYWRVPHFEKMLYDNGQLLSVYAEAYGIEPRPVFRRVVEETVAFAMREMHSDEGGFYTALDAETGGKEGDYYLWNRPEVEKLLATAEFVLAAEVYGFGEEPNFEGGYIPQIAAPLAEIAVRRKTTEDKLLAELVPVRQKLLVARLDRKRPLTDTKILASSNGLMVRGLADAGRILKNPEYTETAAQALDFVLSKLRTSDGRLLRSYSGGRAKLNAFLDDYAFLIDGCISLHQATNEDRWLKVADALMAKQIELFWDDQAGGFFFTSSDHEELIARSKVPTDNATPSGNSVSASNLLYLGRELHREDYLARAEKTIASLAPLMAASPLAAPQMAAVLDQWLQTTPKASGSPVSAKK